MLEFGAPRTPIAYRSSMRSSASDGGGLAEISRAIDELAADYAACLGAAAVRCAHGDRPPAHRDGESGDLAEGRRAPGELADPHHDRDDLADRLARIWMMLSELDPDVARRLPGYGFPPRAGT
jgi:hypothetical protein